jgi:hypothetical protein
VNTVGGASELFTFTMAKFHDLSVDLLYVIFSYLQSDKPLLQDIALSCHLFRDVAQRFFVRDVQISHSPTRSRTKLFLRTLEERPDLIAHVHRLELDLLREDVSWPEEQHCISQITALLFNLREFRYSSRDYKIWHYEIAFPLSLTPENTHSFVRKVEWNHNMTIKTFHECMKLPRIESLYCRELHASDEELENHGKAFERVSSLTDLHLGSSMSSVSLPVEFFRKVLQMPRRLRSLRIDFRDDYRDRVTPEQFAGLLEPVQESLEELTITKTKATTASTGDHHSIDLSGFPMLTKVSLPLKFVFPKGVQSPPFEAETILPPRLNELKVTSLSFYYTTGINN